MFCLPSVIYDMLFDTHTHLNESMEPLGREAFEAAVAASDLTMAMDIGTTYELSRAAVSNAERYPWCYATVGWWPGYTTGLTEADYAALKELAQHPRVKAIGEIGLDYHYEDTDKPAQQLAFRRQIALAKELDLPIVIHDRDAHEDTVRILKEEGVLYDGTLPAGRQAPQPTVPVLFHCYSGSADLAKELARLGVYFALGGSITFKNNKKAPDVAAAIPGQQLLIETDSPYMTPEPHRGTPNVPMYVEFVCRRLAEWKGVSYEDMAALTMANGKRFFRI